MNFEVLIRYCGSCDYESKYTLVKEALKNRYNDISVIGEEIPGKTGSFEVIILKDGIEKVVHSKLKCEQPINENIMKQFLENFDKAVNEID